MRGQRRATGLNAKNVGHGRMKSKNAQTHENCLPGFCDMQKENASMTLAGKMTMTDKTCNMTLGLL